MGKDYKPMETADDVIAWLTEINKPVYTTNTWELMYGSPPPIPRCVKSIQPRDDWLKRTPPGVLEYNFILVYYSTSFNF